MNDQHSKRSAIPGELYRKLAVAAIEAIRSENPNHLIIADGNNVGRDVIPEYGHQLDRKLLDLLIRC